MSNSPGQSKSIGAGAVLISSSVESPECDTGETFGADAISSRTAPVGDVEPLPLSADTRILVVEDERIVGLHLRQQLIKLGYKVIAVVSSGEDALKIVKERKPDVVLMDIHIDGDIDGIETAGRLPPEAGIPVIYLTAFAGESTLQRARATKPYGYMMKPFSERELHATIQMALERRREDQEMRDRESRLLLALGLANGPRTWC
ncbi:MAG TPA: response regulator [Acidisarcina sp.]